MQHAVSMFMRMGKLLKKIIFNNLVSLLLFDLGVEGSSVRAQPRRVAKGASKYAEQSAKARPLPDGLLHLHSLFASFIDLVEDNDVKQAIIDFLAEYDRNVTKASKIINSAMKKIVKA